MSRTIQRRLIWRLKVKSSLSRNFLIILLVGIGSVMIARLGNVDQKEKVRFLHYPFLRVPMKNYDRIDDALNILSRYRRKDKFISIQVSLRDIKFSLDNYNALPEYNKWRIIHILKNINDFIHTISNGSYREAWEDKIINKTTALGLEVNQRGASLKAFQIYKELYLAYKEFYHSERLKKYNETRKSI